MTPWTTTRQASLSITNSRSLLKLMSIESGFNLLKFLNYLAHQPNENKREKTKITKWHRAWRIYLFLLIALQMPWACTIMLRDGCCFSGSTIHSSAVFSYTEEAISYPWVSNIVFPEVISFPTQFPPLNNTTELSSSLELKANGTCLLQIQSPWGRVYLAVIKQMAFHISFKGYRH